MEIRPTRTEFFYADEKKNRKMVRHDKGNRPFPQRCELVEMKENHENQLSNGLGRKAGIFK